jgi:hypothetical protein
VNPDLVVAGAWGMATRTAALERVTLGGLVIDEWELSPSNGLGRIGPLAAAGEGPIYVSVIDPQVGYELAAIDVVVIVCRVDRQLWRTARLHRLPAALAATVAVMAPMLVDDHDHARMVMRHLMRSAVDGAIPTVPAGTDDANLWALTVSTLSRATARAVAAVGAG